MVWHVAGKSQAENKKLEKSAVSKEIKKHTDQSDRVPVQHFLDDFLHHWGFWVQTDFLLVLQGGSAETKRE